MRTLIIGLQAHHRCAEARGLCQCDGDGHGCAQRACRLQIGGEDRRQDSRRKQASRRQGRSAQRLIACPSPRKTFEREVVTKRTGEPALPLRPSARCQSSGAAGPGPGASGIGPGPAARGSGSMSDSSPPPSVPSSRLSGLSPLARTGQQVRSAWARGACHWQPGTVRVLAAARRAGGPRPWTRSPEGRWSPGHNPAVAGRLRTHSGGDQSTHTIGTAGTKSGRLPVVKPV